jgi:fumarate hydratase class II
MEMNVYKPLMIANLIQSITLLTGGCTNFRKYLLEGTKPNVKKIKEHVERSLMLVTALVPVIGYDKASKIAHHAMERPITMSAQATCWRRAFTPIWPQQRIGLLSTSPNYC